MKERAALLAIAIGFYNVSLSAAENQSRQPPSATEGYRGMQMEVRPFRWPDKTPDNCPFPPSEQFGGVEFTGRYRNYSNADTWYPTWAEDGELYSPWTDGYLLDNGDRYIHFQREGEFVTPDDPKYPKNCYSCNSVNGIAGRKAATGQAKIVGADPMNLRVVNILPRIEADPAPYIGRYPCGSLCHNGVWYFGTYSLWGPAGLGPFVGFRYSKDYGKTWVQTSCTPTQPLFGENPSNAPVKIGAPHFVDFGKNLRHSPDGKAYLVAHGSTRREAKNEWQMGDQVFLLRVTPSPSTINDPKAYEFFAGYDAAGEAQWTKEFDKIKPLLTWEDRLGIVTVSYNAPLKKYLMFISRATNLKDDAPHDTMILEANAVTGPWKMVEYLPAFGPNAYFVNLPTKFISDDGRTAWLCYSSCWDSKWVFRAGNPPGSHYSMSLHEIRLLSRATASQSRVAKPGDDFVDDPSARTWLPVKDASAKPITDAATAPVDVFLKTLGSQIRPVACWYSGSRLAATRAFVEGDLKTQGSAWHCDLHSGAVTDERDALDVTLVFRLKEGCAQPAGVAAAFDFSRWRRDNYVLVPAAGDNGNRFHVVNSGYGARYPQSYFFNKDAPLLFSDSPRLSCTSGVPAKIEMLTGNASTPAMCFFSPTKKRGFILLTEQKTRLGNSGLFIEENAAQDQATFVVSAPGVRERAAGFGDFRDSGDAGATWKPGDEVRLRFRLYSFPAKDIPAFLEKFMAVRKSLTGPNHPRNLTPFSATIKFTLDFQNSARWFESPTGSFFRSANCDNLDIGWAGGLIGTFPQLALDEALPRERVFKNIDTVISILQGKSGYFYTDALNGKVVNDRPEVPGMALTRRNADGLFWLVKHFLLLKAQGHGDLIKPEWQQAARRLAQAFVRTWNKEGEFGNYVHPETGEVVIFNSTSGAAAPGGLALAGYYFNDPEYMRVAKASAQFYYNRDVVNLGLTGGGCGDILQDADCESAYGFLGSIMALYEVTGDKEWLTKARTVANLGATWTVSYDYEFPPGNTLYNLKANIAGAVWASVQNKHAAPGICTTSGDYLFKLYRATGERRYAELLRDIMHAHAEVMETPGRPTTGMGPGSSMERITLADGEGKGAIGQILHTSNGWTEDNGMLMALENPGIYVRTDTDEMCVFDHVAVRVVKRDKNGVALEITNPTRFDAQVSVLAESAKQASKPLGYTAFLKWPKVEVKAEETVRFDIQRDK